MIIPRLAEPGSEAALFAPAVETLSSFAAITHVFVPPVDTKVLGIASEMGVSGPGLCYCALVIPAVRRLRWGSVGSRPHWVT